MSTLIRNIKAVDSSKERNLELLIENGLIAQIAEHIEGDFETVLDGGGKVLLPAFTDLHAHFRDPGLTHKEDILSGCRSAVRGGYVNVSLMANTKPVCSSMDTVEYVLEKGKQAGLCRLHQTVSITEGFDGKTLSHLDALDTAKVRWLSDDGVGVADTGVMLAAMDKANQLGLGLMLHEEDPALTHRNLYLAEDLMTTRDVKLAVHTGCKTHFCHVSTIDSLGDIISGKLMCDNITCEVTPHHLCLNDTTEYAVAPPLRDESHRRYLVECLRNGYIDAIATDHAPHTQEDKEKGVNGMVGLECAFAACYTHLVRTGEITLSQLSALMSRNPARILGFEGGVIEPGVPADLVLVDVESPFVFNASDCSSKGHNTPFDGQTFYGRILMTMKQGEIVYEAH
ncbi:dihydroorotase [Oscillospiraceae bacterium MB08-C2-2]|nr:dihydroorotase [Oscillospiraceae bacterium MB08-C2-2]